MLNPSLVHYDSITQNVYIYTYIDTNVQYLPVLIGMVIIRLGKKARNKWDTGNKN